MQTEEGYFNYFKNIEQRYLNRISYLKPIAFRLDGRGVTKQPDIHLLEEYQGGFADALKRTAEQIGRTYPCIVYVGVDEINIIFENPLDVKRMYQTDSIQKIVSLFAQYVGHIFNHYYQETDIPIFFDCRCFNLQQEKIFSYFNYRQQSCYNTSVQYYCKRLLTKEDRRFVPLDEMERRLIQRGFEFSPYVKYGYLAALQGCYPVKLTEALQTVVKREEIDVEF